MLSLEAVVDGNITVYMLAFHKILFRHQGIILICIKVSYLIELFIKLQNSFISVSYYCVE